MTDIVIGIDVQAARRCPVAVLDTRARAGERGPRFAKFSSGLSAPFPPHGAHRYARDLECLVRKEEPRILPWEMRISPFVGPQPVCHPVLSVI